jgi:uncharacterized membrane protein YhaH (DUF805 family)
MKHMSIGQILFSFKGRITRITYWVMLIVFFVSTFLFGMLGDMIYGSRGWNHYVVWLWFLPWIWIGPAVLVKRWHDIGHSGWMILTMLIPLIGGLITTVYCGFIKGNARKNQYGEPPISIIK